MYPYYHLRLFRALLLLFSFINGGFSFLPHTKSIRRLQVINALQLDTFELPLQLNPMMYKTLIEEIIPENEIIRWYIARVENDVVLIEVVREKSRRNYDKNGIPE